MEFVECDSNESGWTELHDLCLKSGDDWHSVTQYLSERPSDLHTTSNKEHRGTDERLLNPLPVGVTPLHCACATGNCVTAEVLLRHFVDVNATDDSGFTPVHYVIKVSKNVQLLQLLYEYVADISVIHQRGNDGRETVVINPINLYLLSTPPDYVEDEEFLSVLLDCVAKETVRVKDQEGRSPLHVAIETGHMAAIRLLSRPERCPISLMDTERDVHGFLPVQKAPLPSLLLLLEAGCLLPGAGYIRARNHLMVRVRPEEGFLMTVALVTAGDHNAVGLMRRFLEPDIRRLVALRDPESLAVSVDPNLLWVRRGLSPEEDNIYPTTAPLLKLLCIKTIRLLMFNSSGNRSIIPRLSRLGLPCGLIQHLDLSNVKNVVEQNMNAVR